MMDFWLIVTLFLVGFVGSFISGMVGIGGAIINYPLLLYVPPLLGMAAFTAHEVSGISAVQVLFATMSGVWAYRKSGYVHKTLILYMGLSVGLGSFIGSYGSNLLSEQAVNLVYGLLATMAAVMMFIPKKEGNAIPVNELTFNKSLAVILAFIVGLGAGVVGAGGSFLLVPVMLTVLNIPMRTTIAASLAITFISAIGSTIGKVTTGQVLYGPAIVLMIAGILATPLGAKIGQKMNTKALQWMLAVLIVGTAIKIWVDF